MKNEDYLVTVEQFVLSFKELGLSLSATDYDLIQKWEKRGIPIDVVCRGIETGFTEFERTNPRQTAHLSLNYLKVFIEKEMTHG